MKPTDITDAQRFTRDQPCSVCGGCKDDPQGEGRRCYGFMSGGTARCTRENFAKGIPLNTDNTGTYTHPLNRDCRCGTRHPAPTWWKPRVTEYEYTKNGLVIGVHMRREWPDGKKDLWWKDLNGRRLESLPLYNMVLLEGLTVPAVIVTEGEKKCDSLVDRGFPAVATATGASSTHDADAFKPLLGKTVYVWPDNDDEGRAHMAKCAARLQEIGHTDVRLVIWPEAPPSGDAADFTGDLGALLEQAVPYGAPTMQPARTGKTYSRTDTGNAERFADQYRDRVRYCDKWKSWMLYDGRRWVKDTDGLRVGLLMKVSILSIYDEAKLLTGDDATDLREWAVKSESASRREGALRLARYELAISVDRFDADPQVLNCRNGALDLRTFTLQPQSAEAFCTLMAETDYVPGATDATWERFITEKLPNPQTRDWVQMGCGYALTGDRREEIMLNFYGPTRGGKTTMAQSLESTLGDYATTVPAEVFMRSRRDNEGEGNRPTLARLKGKRLVVSAEASDHHQLDDGLVKLITGGDPLPATAKYEHPIVFTPEFLWILHGNYLVKVRGDDAAIWNRIRLVPFNVTVKKEAEDPEIKKYLTTDPAARSAIFAWCVEGLRRYRANPVGLKNPPPEVVKATADYRDKMNALATFIEACCVLEPTARVTAGELRLRYEAWCIRENIPAKSRAGSKDMAERLRELRCEEARTKSERSWVGIRLQKPNEGDPS